MSVSFRLFPWRYSSHMRHEGRIEVADAENGFGGDMRHPDCAVGVLQRFDLSGTPGWTGDFMQILRRRATRAGVFLKDRLDVPKVAETKAQAFTRPGAGGTDPRRAFVDPPPRPGDCRKRA